MSKAKHVVFGLILPLLILGAWYYATNYKEVPAAILPSIGKVGLSFKKQVVSGQLIKDLSISLGRVLKGYSLAAILGVSLGICMGIWPVWNSTFSLTLHTIRQIPMLAWIPLIIMWFGIGEESKVIVIILGAFFPILINTISGISSTPQMYIEVANLYKLNKWQIIRKVYVPYAIPQIFVGLKLGLGTSWMAVVAAEMLGASSGIGFRITDARSLMQPQVVIVGMIVIGIIGVLMDKILTQIVKVVTPWNRTAN